MDEFELVADEFTPPRGDCPRFLVAIVLRAVYVRNGFPDLVSWIL
jgi:hypothetical protein